MKRILNLLGWAGVALVVAALALMYFRPDKTALRQGLAIAGLVCVLLYMFSDWREIVAAFSRRQARYGALSIASVIIVLALLVGINYVAGRQNKRWDLTASGQFSLSDQTRKVLKDLKQPVTLTVYDRDTQFTRFRDRLSGYEYLSPNVKVEYVDIDRQPARARDQQVQQYGTLVVNYEGRVERTTSDEEQDITNAIVKAVQGQQKRVYFLQGHGERDTGSSDERSGYNGVAGALARDNFTVEKLVLAQLTEIPADASVLVAAGPTADYLPQEIDMLRRYLRKGGKLLLMVDPPERSDSPARTGLLAFAREWGMELGNDVVLDPVGQALGMGADAPVAATYPAHPITERFNVLTAFPLTQSVSAVSGGVEGRFAQAIVETSPQSFAKKDLGVLRAGGQVALDESQGDRPGPISIAAAMSATAPDAAAATPPPAPDASKPASEPPAPKPETRVVVYGDSDFASNAVLGLGGNRDLFLNTVNWLAQQENLIAIRAREAEDRRITPSPGQSRWALAQSLLVLPGLVLLLGFYTWWRRR